MTSRLDFAQSTAGTHLSGLLLLKPGESWLPPSNAMQLRCALLLSRGPALVIPWTVACQAPLSTGFPRQEYWSGLPFPTPGDLPDPGTEPASLAPRTGRQILYLCATGEAHACSGAGLKLICCREADSLPAGCGISFSLPRSTSTSIYFTQVTLE